MLSERIKFLVILISVGLSIASPAYGQSHLDKKSGINVATPEPTDPSYFFNLAMESQSWFTDTISRAFIYTNAPVELKDELPKDTSDVRFVDIELSDLKNSKLGKHLFIVSFLPKRKGFLEFPPLEFVVGEELYSSNAMQFTVGSPQASDFMSLSIVPSKTEVYVGEPLRVDIEWECLLPDASLRQLQFNPSFFYQDQIEVDVPRVIIPEESKVGIPVGGRRVIAERTVSDVNGGKLGKVCFSLYMRFKEPGQYAFPKSRLECVRLFEFSGKFAPYQAYFNNRLFEVVDPLLAYARLYAESEQLEFRVIALPEEGRTASFSGLFAPCRIEASIQAAKAEVGQLVEVNLQVYSKASNGFLNLPLLNVQRSLRSRFWVAEHMSRLWQPYGGEFNTRVRPLTTEIGSFPVLEFQVFNADKGIYEIVSTKPQPLKILALDGVNYFDMKSLSEGESSLTDSLDGMWQNDEVDLMNDILNYIVNIFADFFWFFLLGLLIVFCSFIPLARELRRRAMDVDYRRTIEAYKAFWNMPDDAKAKWRAFRGFLAAGSCKDENAFTVQDAVSALEGFGVSKKDVSEVKKVFSSDDAAEYSRSKPEAKLPELNMVAKRIYKLMAKTVTVLLLGVMFLLSDLEGSAWEEGQSFFAAGLELEAGAEEAEVLFAEAALKFEASASEGIRPGSALYNAGNAWFRIGELGRAIASYKQARHYRPFDSDLKDNLKAARALTIDIVAKDTWSRWFYWPVNWLRAVLVVLVFLFFLMLWIYLRYHNRIVAATICLCGISSLMVTGLLTLAESSSDMAGVLTADETYVRKGPAYSYSVAFNEPLHNGTEFFIVSERNDWLEVELEDGRICWLPASQVQRIPR